MSFERRIRFNAAWDKRAEGYGIHGVEIEFALIGAEGAVRWTLMTNWTLDMSRLEPPLFNPIPAQLVWHGRLPREADDERKDCDLLGQCYDAGVTFCSDDLFDVLRREGDEGLWRELEGKYWSQFTPVEGAVQ